MCNLTETAKEHPDFVLSNYVFGHSQDERFDIGDVENAMKKLDVNIPEGRINQLFGKWVDYGMIEKAGKEYQVA